MTREDFIDMCKRMVMEYYNRYFDRHHSNQSFSSINIDDVFVVMDLYDNDNLTREATLQVSNFDWPLYKVIYNGQAGKRDNVITSFVMMK